MNQQQHAHGHVESGKMFIRIKERPKIHTKAVDNGQSSRKHEPQVAVLSVFCGDDSKVLSH